MGGRLKGQGRLIGIIRYTRHTILYINHALLLTADFGEGLEGDGGTGTGSGGTTCLGGGLGVGIGVVLGVWCASCESLACETGVCGGEDFTG